MLNDLNMWNKIGRIVSQLATTLNIDIEKALDICYTSDTCRKLHDKETGLYLLADACIVDDIIKELNKSK